MIIACNCVARDCSANDPKSAYSVQLTSGSGVFDPHDIEDYYVLGADLPHPFTYEVWEIVTLVGPWLRRYYLLSDNGDPMAYPIYVTTINIEEKILGPQQAVMLLGGMSAWHSKYYGRDQCALTPRLVWLEYVMRRRFSDRDEKESLIYDIYYRQNMYKYQAYNLPGICPSMMDALRDEEYNSAFIPTINTRVNMDDTYSERINQLLVQDIDKIDADEIDLILMHSKKVNITRLQQYSLKTTVTPLIQEYIDDATNLSPISEDNASLTTTFLSEEDVSIIRVLADICLDYGYFEFSVSFSENEKDVNSELAWNIIDTPEEGNPIQKLILDWKNKSASSDIEKLNVFLDRGHLNVTLKLKGDAPEVQFHYCLLLHCLAASNIIILDSSIPVWDYT